MSLSFWAAKALIGSKRDFFTDDSVAPVLKDYICDVYEKFNICQNCPTACLTSKPGIVILFQHFNLLAGLQNRAIQLCCFPLILPIVLISEHFLIVWFKRFQNLAIKPTEHLVFFFVVIGHNFQVCNQLKNKVLQVKNKYSFIVHLRQNKIVLTVQTFEDRIFILYVLRKQKQESLSKTGYFFFFFTDKTVTLSILHEKVILFFNI